MFFTELNPPSGRKFLFNCVVWGEGYTRKLLDFTLPTLLSLNNIPALVKRRPCEFMFVTTPEDADLIRSSPCYEQLSTFMPIVFSFPDFNVVVGNKYARMTFGHDSAVRYGREIEAYGVFLMPEMLAADGSLLYLDLAVRSGKRAVIMVVLRVIEDHVQYLRGNTEITLSSRELVSLVQGHAHSEIRSFVVNGDRFSKEPGYVIWDYSDRGVWIVHGIHSQPMLVDLKDAVPEQLGHAIDAGDFVVSAVKDLSEIEVVQDSDLAMMCSLTPAGDVPTAADFVDPTAANVRHFIQGTPYVTATHLWYFTHSVVLHSGDTVDDIAALTEPSNRFVAEVLS